MCDFFRVTKNDSTQEVISGYGIEDALEQKGLSMDDIKSFDNSSKKEYDEEHKN